MKFKSWQTEENSQSVKPFHEIVWYIERPLTLKQWIELDDKMSDVLESFAPGEFWGYAGPLPTDDWYTEAKKIYEKEKE